MVFDVKLRAHSDFFVPGLLSKTADLVVYSILGECT